MKRKIFFTAITFLILTQACIRDMGNYDYLDINELEFVGFQTSDGVDGITGQSAANPINVEDAHERFTLIPVIRTSMKTEENLVFSWLTLDTLGERTVFHEGRNLIDTVFPSYWSGDVWVVFRIEDVVSRKILDTRIFVNVINSFQRGLMVLQEDAQGFMRLDMLSWRPGTGEYPKVGYRHLTDVLKDTDFPKQQGARQIVTFSDHVQSVAFGGRAIYIVTDEIDVYRIHPTSFEWLGEAGHLRHAFLSPAFFPSNAKVSRFSENGTTAVLLNMDGQLFHQNAMGRFFSVELNTRPNRERFSASPHVSRVGERFLIFDEDTRSFYALFPARDSWAIPLPTSAETLTSFRTMNKELIFSQAASTEIGASVQHFSYNILSDGDDFWVLRVVMEDWTQNSWQRMNNVPAGFGKNALMAVGGEFVDREMYVAIHNAVYMYDIHNNSFHRVLTLPPGEEITFMGFVQNTRYFGPTDDEVGFDAYRLLLVGSYNDATGGTLTHYSIPLGIGLLQPYTNSRTGQRHHWEGFGRIRDVSNR